MSFFAVLIALLIEQLKPLPRDNWVHHRLVVWVGWVGRNFDAGKPRHVWVVWCVSVLTPTLLVALAYLGISRYSLVLALLFDVAVLYVTLGFRQFSHYFTDLREALDNGDDNEVRRLLAEWLHLDAGELPHTEVLRHVVEHALLAAHRHVFGVFFWFIVCSALGLGPAGAVLMTEHPGVLDESVLAQHLSEALLVDEMVVAAVDLAGPPWPRGEGHRKRQ